MLTCAAEQIRDGLILHMHTRLCQETRLWLLPAHLDKLSADMMGLVQLLEGKAQHTALTQRNMNCMEMMLCSLFLKENNQNSCHTKR